MIKKKKKLLHWLNVEEKLGFFKKKKKKKKKSFSVLDYNSWCRIVGHLSCYAILEFLQLSWAMNYFVSVLLKIIRSYYKAMYEICRSDCETGV